MCLNKAVHDTVTFSIYVHNRDVYVMQFLNSILLLGQQLKRPQQLFILTSPFTDDKAKDDRGQVMDPSLLTIK